MWLLRQRWEVKKSITIFNGVLSALAIYLLVEIQCLEVFPHFIGSLLHLQRDLFSFFVISYVHLLFEGSHVHLRQGIAVNWKLLNPAKYLDFFWLTVYFRFKYKIFAIMGTFFHSSYKTVNSSVHKREWEHLNTEHHQQQDGCFALPCDGFLNGLPSNCGLIVSLSLVKLSDCLTSATPSPVSSDKSASHFETCLAIVIYVLW